MPSCSTKDPPGNARPHAAHTKCSGCHVPSSAFTTGPIIISPQARKKIRIRHNTLRERRQKGEREAGQKKTLRGGDKDKA